MLVPLPPSPQQAGNWPMGFRQSQKTVSLALQAYRTLPYGCNLTGQAQKAKNGVQGNQRAEMRGARGGGGEAFGSHMFSMCESQPATHKVVDASVPQMRNRLPLHMHKGMSDSVNGTPKGPNMQMPLQQGLVLLPLQLSADSLESCQDGLPAYNFLLLFFACNVDCMCMLKKLLPCTGTKMT